MLLKQGVSLDSLKPEVRFALGFVQAAFANFGAGEIVITSANDSTHSTKSLHYRDFAVDVRTKNLAPDARDRIATFLRQHLDPYGFDTLLESAGLPNEHLHCEYDPKLGERLVAAV